MGSRRSYGCGNLDRAEPIFVKLDSRRMKEMSMSNFDIEATLPVTLALALH